MPHGVQMLCSIVTLTDLTVSRRDRTLLDVKSTQFDLAPGVSALIGPNGAGKSTLLKVLRGLIQPDTGSIDWPEGNIPNRAILLQNPTLLRRTCAENLAFILKRRKISGSDLRENISTLLERAHLSEAAQIPARHLSGGQQRRLAFAMALGQDPALMLLDEPTAGLDPAASIAVEMMIRQTAERGVRIIMSSHDLGQVSRIADDVQFFHGGHVVETGPSDIVLTSPRERETQAFISGKLTW